MQPVHRSPPSHPVSRCCPYDLLKAAEAWPEPWSGAFKERLAIMMVDAGHVWLTAVRFAFRDTLEAARRDGVRLEAPWS